MQTNIVLFGAPGSGKGTQAKLIAEKFGFDHVSTGDLFRYEISHKTPLGLKAQEIINRGDLCPDDITLGMLNNHIQKHADSKGFIFDGVPRTIKQAEMLDDKNLFKDLNISMVLYLYVEMEEVEKRILKRAQLENRADDTPETVKARVANFFDQTMPLVDYYKNQGKLIQLNGMQDIEHVFADICKTIENHK
ncbi:MAG: adenylate kinase [Bacteroidales bacterium]|jgi:adenylate kinase|nr:adenylate kinase [Bacteroidales bacterium]MBR3573518.1 adenylate kinase [Bacteroidales bacterium]